MTNNDRMTKKKKTNKTKTTWLGSKGEEGHNFAGRPR